MAGLEPAFSNMHLPVNATLADGRTCIRRDILPYVDGHHKGLNYFRD